MEALFLFIVKSSGLLLLFYCAYYFLLRKETFFNSNRWFLLMGLFTSILLPLIVYTKIICIAPTPISGTENHAFHTTQIAKASFQIDWNITLLMIYSIGFLALVLKFAFDFYSLNSILKGKKVKQQADFKFIDLKENIAPFSYFNYIVYNSSLYTASELENIIEHEKVHSEQNHTVDVLISRVFCVLFWFNPIIWLYKKAILQNLEFIADSEAAQKLTDRKAYQYTLLKITTHENCVAITNHFYQSLIKKRIIMLNKNQSKKRNSWKFCVVAPALVAFVLLFQIEVIAKEKEEVKKEVSGKLSKEKMTSTHVYKIKKSTTDKELKVMAETLKLTHNLDAIITDLKRNENNQLTAIKLELKQGAEIDKTFMVGGSKAIKDCGIVVITYNDGSKKINFVSGEDIDNTKVAEVTTVKEKANSKNNINTETNVKTNSDSNTNVSTSTSTTTNVGTNVAVSVNNDTKNLTTIKISSKKGKDSKDLDQLVIIDGVVASGTTKDELQKLDIKSMTVYKGVDALVKYGEEGANGVIIIETRN